MSRHKKDKKIKKKEKIQQITIEDKIKYDIFEILKNEKIDTKPNLGKFLNTYVKEIRGCTGGKIILYPDFRYQISKVLVEFFDKHMLIYCKNGINGPRYYLYDNLDEISIKDRDLVYIQNFFANLENFKFIT